MKEREMTADVLVYSLVAAAFAKQGKWEAVQALMRGMEGGREGGRVEPNVHMYNHLIRAYVKAGKRKEALSVLQTMSEGGKKGGKAGSKKSSSSSSSSSPPPFSSATFVRPCYDFPPVVPQPCPL